jgi:NAD(P)-dependent dehydrogenase (short-subunit alcohol dehydrogenase family)
VTPLAGRVAVVAGASRGIGLATARALAAAGATVVRLARSLESGAGGEFVDLRCDLTREDDLRAALDSAAAAVGPPDIVVASTGAFALAPFESITAEQLDGQLSANLRGPFALTQRAAAGMRARGGGLIVLIGSIADHVGLPGNTAYAASKYALRGLHETLVAELRGSGVRCTLLSPGATDTPLWDPIDPDGRDDLPDRAAMLRPADVAEAVVFLATRPPHVHIDWMRIGPA